MVLLLVHLVGAIFIGAEPPYFINNFWLMNRLNKDRNFNLIIHLTERFITAAFNKTKVDQGGRGDLYNRIHFINHQCW